MHNNHEHQTPGDNLGDVEQLKLQVELEADAVAAPEQFGDQHNLPDQRDARTTCRRDIRSQLGQDKVAQGLPFAEPINERHFPQIGIHRAHALAYRHDDIGDFVDRDGDNERDLGQAQPDIRQYHNDQRRDVEKENKPRVKQGVDAPEVAHRKANRDADEH